ncbi:MAG: hypothetical protein LAP13_02510 [Acidobacteriia bacterium]|nr:hypothetical protein [Terriglobia bacterium]
MFAKSSLLIIVLLAGASFAAGQTTAIPLVPAANWRQVSSEPLGLTVLRNWGGDPAVEREYGVTNLEQRTYQLGKINVNVIVEPASDATAAYGLYTFYSPLGQEPEKGIQLAVLCSEGALMARGKNFVRFLRPRDSGLSDDDFRALLIYVGGTRPPSQVLTMLPVPMPTKDLVPGSSKYLVGLEGARQVLPDFRAYLLGFDQGGEVQVGDYQTGATRSRLLAVSYPTPQIARIRFGAMTDFLGINRVQGAQTIYGRREGSFVFLVLNADSPATANALMDEFRVAGQVVRDEPYPGDKPFAVQVLELILANVILILILIGLCVVGGVMVFLSRRVAAKWFPDWQWGHTDEETLIQLHLERQ